MLGNLTQAQFLREYWQKKPLLLRNAFPGFAGLLSPAELMALAGREDAQSRIVRFQEDSWILSQGPFTKREFRKLSGLWTLLVQGVNHFMKEGDELLSRFDFIPRARLDDLMVSYAPDGAGVGPHFDSYDVFLLQGMGRRRWQISANTPADLVPDAPLRILSRFEVEQEWILEPGDMLYLPPKYAHNGIAMGESMTYSIGFRAPSAQELATEFLVHLQDRIELSGMYEDQDLQIQEHPAEIGREMRSKVRKMLSGITWGEQEVEHFLGMYLTEPKGHIFFDPPEHPVSMKKFASGVARNGLSLDLRTQMLFCGESLYINGESESFSGLDRDLLVRLADRRSLPPVQPSEETLSLFHQWYEYGYVVIGGGE
ncbi:MAG: cupin domain-containing protein [Burkholderiales bacterium]|nr:cupin domain-containing protein [Burkholderiales bacterium]